VNLSTVLNHQQAMQRLPVFHQSTTRPDPSSENNLSILALWHMGPRLSGAFQDGPWWLQVVVAVDKLTKWIEVCTVTTVTSKEVAKFIEDITHQFGVPNRIVTDLGKVFIQQPTSRHLFFFLFL
jgi:hypothetical protein